MGVDFVVGVALVSFGLGGFFALAVVVSCSRVTS